ncbi:MAG: GNAT family N-acetyltransferase [Actinomycetota bacterium]|nr:GNAT family N-acetyltransferase [Actinomycetota bacterium]
MTDIRPLTPENTHRSSLVHSEVLGVEFLARFGTRFLRAYHRAWLDSPWGLALAASDSQHEMVGVVLASLDPAQHYRWMLTHSGPRLAAHMVAGTTLKPALARDLLVTRGPRYARAVWRQLTAGKVPAPAVQDGPPVAEVTHLMVSGRAQGAGTGKALLGEVEKRAAAAGLHQLVLVTPPDLASRHFYEHLGWSPSGIVISRSGEEFIRFTRQVGAPVGTDTKW